MTPRERVVAALNCRTPDRVAEVETVTVNLSPALLGGPRLFVRMRAAQP
jgi:hypothetical protein